MLYQIKASQDQVNVVLSGKVYVEESTVLREELLRYIQDGYKHYVIDVRNLEFIDSSGLGVLVAVQKRALMNGGGITIAGLSGSVKEIFELTRLTRIFTIQP
ncbi:STAS domain-containing protein [Brevibacillus sp. SYSU BS000544]|uniref:STAS domain-containing protein n=1 Tax=Brevibacillus sp. SYSU BS000544 TaxID=3416443 RepID=UPI003CE597AB